jgi:multiple sugar transport system permease protein
MKSGSSRRSVTPYLLHAPTLAVVVGVVIFPLVYSAYISFFRYNPISGESTPVFAGADNYVWAVTSPRVQHSLLNMVYYTGAGVCVEVLLGLALALAVHNYIRRPSIKVLALAVLLVPLMTSPIVGGDLWKLLLVPQGAINAILEMIGIPPTNWFSADLALTSVLIADIWQWTSLPFLILYAARTSLPTSLYEATELDGASDYQVLRKITLPMLRTPLVIALLLRMMDSYKIFDALFIMTFGGPGSASELPTFFTYLVGFRQFDVGRAAALNWIIGLGAALMMGQFWNRLKAIRGGVR